LLWAMLATERTVRRRSVSGLLGFVALDAAVLVRYTNVVILTVAVLAVLLVFRRAALPLRAVRWWLGSVAAMITGAFVFDQLAYGSPLKTGYSSGEITFSLASVIPNLQRMPAPLVTSLPMMVLALGALGWLAVRAVASRQRGIEPERRTRYRRDVVVGACLATGWMGVWGLYAAYDWTARTASMPGSGIHVVRFYLPALGLISLLGAWLLAQLPRWLPVVILIVLIGLGAKSYPDLVAGGFAGPGMGGLAAHPPPVVLRAVPTEEVNWAGSHGDRTNRPATPCSVWACRVLDVDRNQNISSSHGNRRGGMFGFTRARKGSAIVWSVEGRYSGPDLRHADASRFQGQGQTQ